jgi:hypothetical protein
MIFLPGCPSLQTGGRDQIGTVAAIKLEYMAGMRWNPQLAKRCGALSPQDAAEAHAKPAVGFP